MTIKNLIYSFHYVAYSRCSCISGKFDLSLRLLHLGRIMNLGPTEGCGHLYLLLSTFVVFVLW